MLVNFSTAAYIVCDSARIIVSYSLLNACCSIQGSRSLLQFVLDFWWGGPSSVSCFLGISTDCLLVCLIFGGFFRGSCVKWGGNMAVGTLAHKLWALYVATGGVGDVVPGG